MRRKTLSGTVIISRSSGGDESQPIHITIQDDISRSRVLEIYMALDQFANALTATYGAATIEHFPDSPIGKKAENKTEIVPFRSWPTRDKAAINAALAPFEVDGWKARRSDMTNGHFHTPKGQRVVFFRHVDVETEVPNEAIR